MDAANRRSFADRLAHLVRTVHPPDREPYSYREIAVGIADRGGPSMSAQYINQLANGTRGRTGVKSQYVHALAQFFGVPDEYFLDDNVAKHIDSQVTGLTVWRDHEAREIAERAMALSPSARATVSHLIDSLRAYESEPRQHRRRRKLTVSEESPTVGDDA